MQPTEGGVYLNEDRQVEHLPSGETPFVIKYKKPINKRNNKSVETLKLEILRRICNTTAKEGVSILCLNRHDDCILCKKIRNHCEKEIGEPKMVMSRDDDGDCTTSGYDGCEDENVIIHYTSSSYTGYEDVPFDLLSRARRKMLLLFEEAYLKYNNPFSKTISEMISHDKQNCGNTLCKNEGWTKKKVVNLINID